MKLLGTGSVTGIIFILLMLLILFVLLQFKRIILFKILAKVNKIIFPSLFTKDISKLKHYERLILAYRYWVTKNSL